MKLGVNFVKRCIIQESGIVSTASSSTYKAPPKRTVHRFSLSLFGQASRIFTEGILRLHVPALKHFNMFARDRALSSMKDQSRSANFVPFSYFLLQRTSTVALCISIKSPNQRSGTIAL